MILCLKLGSIPVGMFLQHISTIFVVSFKNIMFESHMKKFCSLAKVMGVAASLILATSIATFGQQFSELIYSISTAPGENVSSQMGISWAVDTTVSATAVLYTQTSDKEWKHARAAFPQQMELCNTFYGVASHNAKGEDITEYARFIKCGVLLDDLKPDTDYKYIVIASTNSKQIVATPVQSDAESTKKRAPEPNNRTLKISDINALKSSLPLRSSEHVFRTAGAKEWSCCIISDFHSYTPLPGRLTSAMGMIDTMAKFDPSLDFIFSPGDVVAWGGSYSFWRRLFEEKNFEKYMWARVNGNHDNWNKMTVTEKAFDTPPAYFLGTSYFPKNGYDIPQPADSTLGLSDSQIGVCYHFRYGNTLFIMLNTEDMFRRNELQAAHDWTRKVVTAARKGKNPPTFIVVCMHYEWFHGTDGKNSSYKHWHELFDELGVDLAVAGNNHVYLRTEPIFHNVVNRSGASQKVNNSGEISKTDGAGESDCKSESVPQTANGLGTVYLQTSSSDNGRGRSISEKEFQNSNLIEKRWSEGAHTISAIHMAVDRSSISLKLMDRNGNIIDSTIIRKK